MNEMMKNCRNLLMPFGGIGLLLVGLLLVALIALVVVLAARLSRRPR